MTHPQRSVEEVLALAEEGLSAAPIATRTGIPRGTVKDWLAGRVPARPEPGIDLRALPPEYVYLLGVYLGDGCLARHRRGVYKLRVALDAAYPGIVGQTVRAMEAVMPSNSVNCCLRDTWVEVYCYSREWPRLFPQHGPGRKHERPIRLAPWQRAYVEREPRLLLRGLIHSDGCRFMNTGRRWSYPRYSFTNLSEGIREIFCDACDLIDVHWTWSPPKTIYVSRVADVRLLNEFIGPKA